MTIRVMLVDDNKTFLSAVRHLLETQPHTRVVAEAHDGKVALEMAASIGPDLVLLDIAMPGMNGLEVARALNGLLAPPCIVFLSMHSSATYRAAARELGAFGYIVKADLVAELPPMIALLEQPLAGRGSTLPGSKREHP